MEYKYIFGPVPSRRLGLSLGVDLMPHKTCSLDCVYCECGKTTHLTVERKNYIPVDEIFKELDTFLAQNSSIDHITFSGSGEPTLHNGIGDIITFLKTRYPQFKIALLTNSTLLSLPSVRESIVDTDVVVASVDAASDIVYKKINRPHPELNASTLIEGLISFRKEFKNKLWIEFFVIPGINDNPAELDAIKNAVNLIKPDKIQINTLDRPGTESWVKSADENKIKKILQLFDNANLIHFKETHSIIDTTDDVNSRILATLLRRPCTADDMSKILGVHIDKVKIHIDRLLKKRKIEKKEQGRGIFYRVIN